MPDFLLFYLFLCFVIGIACLGALVASARRHSLAASFLPVYGAFSLLLVGGLGLAYAQLHADSSLAPWTRVFEYIEAFPGSYGLFLALPLFAHRALGARHPVRERVYGVLLAIVFALQHWTEYVAAKSWDDRGDLLENLVFLAVIGYVVWFVWQQSSWRESSGSAWGYRFWVVCLALLLCLAAVVHDLFLTDATTLRFYPAIYALFCVVATWLIVSRGANTTELASPQLPAEWNLSPRERDVAELVCSGLANKEIAQQLGISPNTVKTHIRAVFEKSGTSSRYELIAVSQRKA